VLLDFLAEEILATYTELGFDETYIQEKRLSLMGKTKFEILQWCDNNLDSTGKAALADRLRVDADELNIAINIVAGL
jgi:hypothetical protein